MEKPSKFGFIRNNGIVQDTAYRISQELDKLDSLDWLDSISKPEIWEQKRFYYDALLRLGLKNPRHKKPGKPGKRIKKVKIKAQEEQPSSTNWEQKLTGG